MKPYAEIVKERGYLTLTKPKRWTKEEIDLLKSDISTSEIAKILNRTLVSVGIKRKRLKKKLGTGYNSSHINEKYEKNTLFLDIVKPESLVDAFSGEVSFYSGKVKKLLTNDIKFGGEEAHFFLEKIPNDCYDIVDLDPFGSCYKCFEKAILIAKKGLVITFGELGHKRFKRLDFVNKIYGIEKLEQFNLKYLEDFIIKLGKKNGKDIKVVLRLEKYNIGRTWFSIKNEAK